MRAGVMRDGVTSARCGGLKMREICGLFVFCALISQVSVARADPELRAELLWRGSCDDAEDLTAQVRARGAELRLPSASEPTKVESAPAVRVAVVVNQSAPSTLIALIQIHSKDGNELRRVQASACGGLRSAVAWVLVVLAQQSDLERQSPRPSERKPSAAVPASAPSAAFGPLADASAPLDGSAGLDAFTSRDGSASPAPQRRPTTAASSTASRTDENARSTPKPVSTWGLGCSFTGAVGLLSAPAFGPMLLVRYHAGAKGLPTLQLSVQRLVTSGFESNGTSISLMRDAARLGAWLPLVGRLLNVGAAAEAGRLVASGAGPSLEHGSRDSAFWLAFALPLRLSIPVVGQSLRAEVQLELDYSPVPYTFRYGSGDTLSSTTAFEGRGQLGLISVF